MAVLPTHEQTTRSIGILNPFEQNSRTHSEAQIEEVCNSMRKFGFTNPVLIDEDNTIIAGHCRITAAKIVGIDEIPCVILKGLSDVDKAAYVIADNKLALNAGWDFNILQNQFEYLKANEFDTSLTGFSRDEIDQIMQPLEIGGLCNDDECPDVPEEPKTVIGDLYFLGNHRLLCGDSTVQTDVDRLLDGQAPNTMVTDPPYGVKLDMSWRNEARGGKNNENVVKNDDRSDWYDTYTLFPGSIAYVWHASAYTDVVMSNLRDAGFEPKQQIIWNKSHFVLGRSNYHWQHEPCWYAVKKGAKSNWKGDRKQTTVWDFSAPNMSNSGSKDDKTEHPTQKPVELFYRSIKHHTNSGEYVYDPFAGSGTLMIACEKSDRRALMMELDPKYCDVIVARWEKFTGKKAVLHDRK